MFGSFRIRELRPRLSVLILDLYHIGRRRMIVNLHLFFRCIELDCPYFDSRLDFLAEHSALVSNLRNGVVPLAVLAGLYDS